MRRLLGAGVVALVLLAGCSFMRPTPLAENCAGWSRLNAGDQALTAEALIQPSLMGRVRERQQLPPDTPDGQVYLAVVSSITKTCDLQGLPELALAQIVSDLYASS